MAHIQVTTGLGALKIGGFTDEELTDILDAFGVAVAGGERGIWCELAPREGDGAGLAWIPLSVPVTFAFDAEELPVDPADLPVVAVNETSD